MKRICRGFILSVLAFFLTNTAFHARATNISMPGSCSYSIDGDTCVLSCSEVLNNQSGGASGTLRLELWAFSSPFTGTGNGYILASYNIGTLSGGYYWGGSS